MAGDGEFFVIPVQGKLNLLLLMIEAYKADVITLQELIQVLVVVLNQD